VIYSNFEVFVCSVSNFKTIEKRKNEWVRSTNIVIKEEEKRKSRRNLQIASNSDGNLLLS
jgi:hypothetical protein